MQIKVAHPLHSDLLLYMHLHLQHWVNRWLLYTISCNNSYKSETTCIAIYRAHFLSIVSGCMDIISMSISMMETVLMSNEMEKPGILHLVKTNVLQICPDEFILLVMSKTNAPMFDMWRDPKSFPCVYVVFICLHFGFGTASLKCVVLALLHLLTYLVWFIWYAKKYPYNTHNNESYAYYSIFFATNLRLQIWL